MKKIKFFISFLVILSLGFIATVKIVSAQPIINSTDPNDPTKLCDCSVDISSLQGNCYKYCTGNYEINDFVLVLIIWIERIIGLVGSLALLMFVYGGVVWITAAGVAERISKGRSIMLNALLGIVIVFTSYMIIEFVLGALGYEDVKIWNQIKN